MLKRTSRALRFFTRAESARAWTAPEEYWANAAKGIEFSKPYDKVLNRTANHGVGSWFEGSELNVCHNAVDRHVRDGRGDAVAFYYDSPLTSTKYALTYSDLLHRVSAMARVLANHGVRAGDTVLVYMSNSPEAVATMLATARLGATHSVVFGGFAAPELAKRVADCKPRVLVCSSWGVEPSRIVNYKALVDQALSSLPNHTVTSVIVHQRVGLPTPALTPKRDHLLQTEIDGVQSLATVPCVPVPWNHPLYLLYTSGTTGLPKGIVRDTAGIAVMLHHTMETIFGLDDGRRHVIFCTSDIGWIVGHNYIVYAPLLRGVPSVLFEGKPVGTPNPGAFFRVVEEYSATAIYSAPTAFRAIRAADPHGEYRRQYDTSSLRTLFLAGERSDPPTLEWAGKLLDVPVVDNWWQTETGSPISSCPALIEGGVTPDTHFGAAGVACPGWHVHVRATSETATSGLGEILMELPLPPGAMTGIWGRPNAMQEIYLTEQPGNFQTFDAGKVDEDGFVHVMARTDDVINVAGHRLSTGEMEQVLTRHEAVAEAAVVGMACKLKGERPVAIVVLKHGHAHSDLLAQNLDAMLRKEVGPIASAHCHVVPRLPKTRSGKVVRKLLRQILERKATTPPPTLEDHGVVAELHDSIHGPPQPNTPPQ